MDSVEPEHTCQESGYKISHTLSDFPTRKLPLNSVCNAEFSGAIVLATTTIKTIWTARDCYYSTTADGQILKRKTDLDAKNASESPLQISFYIDAQDIQVTDFSPRSQRNNSIFI